MTLASRVDGTDALYLALLSDRDDLLEHLEEILARPAWQADAACIERPEVNYFPERGARTGPAKAVCARCLVRAECLEYALDLGAIVQGIWGGTSEAERRIIRRARATIVHANATR